MALPVIMLILLVMALLGVSALRGAVLEKRMAANSQFVMQVFQAAETAIEGALDDPTALTEALNGPLGGSGVERTFAVTPPAQPYSVTSRATVGFDGEGTARGFSVNAYSGFDFTLRGRGAIADSGARADHTLTAERVGPRGG